MALPPTLAASVARLTKAGQLITGATCTVAPPGASHPATHLTITTQPSSSVTTGVAFAQQPAIQLRDASNNPVLASGVTITVAENSGGGSLGGTLVASTNSSGLATFTNLVLTGASTDTLIFTSTGLTSVVSSIVTVSGGGSAPLSLLFNSLEPGGDGSDPNVLWADDFTRGYRFRDTDSAGITFNGPDLFNAGWNPTPFGGLDPQGTNFGRANQGVGGNKPCATNGGHPVGDGSGFVGQALAMGDHSLASSVTELYFRYYVKFLTGYQFGQEKGLTFNKGVAGIGGIFAGTLFYGLSATTSTPPQPTFLSQDIDQNLGENQGNNYAIVVGHWNCIQVHIKFGPSPGTDTLEVWMDDCGVLGTTHPGSPTLRMQYTATSLRSASHDPDPSLLSIWVECWANPPAIGETYYDYIMCKKTGPIGFAV